MLTWPPDLQQILPLFPHDETTQPPVCCFSLRTSICSGGDMVHETGERIDGRRIRPEA
jgi:hypothetical protein